MNPPMNLDEVNQCIDKNIPLSKLRGNRVNMDLVFRQTIFAEGNERACFRALEKVKRRLWVLKEFKTRGRNHHSWMRYERVMSCSVLAQFLAERYNDALADAAAALNAETNIGNIRKLLRLSWTAANDVVKAEVAKLLDPLRLEYLPIKSIQYELQLKANNGKILKQVFSFALFSNLGFFGAN